MLNVNEIQDIFESLGFTPRDIENNYQLREWRLTHPENERLVLEGFIDLVPWSNPLRYNNVSLFTLIGDSPLTTLGDPLNIVVGLSQVHEAELFRAIVAGVTDRFKSLPISKAALSYDPKNWYKPVR